MTVKLLLVDPDDRLLLIRGRDPVDGAHHWYPVGGGIHPGESHHEAAAREAWEESGLALPHNGETVWTRQTRYTFAGATYDVHETWLRYRVPCFDPAPARLSELEQQSMVGFRWWTVEELRSTEESVFPAVLGERLAQLHAEGCPDAPIDISTPGSLH